MIYWISKGAIRLLQILITEEESLLIITLKKSLLFANNKTSL